MNWVDVLGHVASAISSLTFIPQVYHTWKTKSVRDLNLWMILIVFISTVIWLIYGIEKELLPVVICNSIICLLSLVMIYFKYKYSNLK
jgi:MtN3 and saliva related transmembrane protein